MITSPIFIKYIEKSSKYCESYPININSFSEKLYSYITFDNSLKKPLEKLVQNNGIYNKSFPQDDNFNSALNSGAN